MTHSQILTWLTRELKQWPQSTQNIIQEPAPWRWVADYAWINGRYTTTLFLININTGEVIDDELFSIAKFKTQLKPCGLSFKELIKTL